MCIQAFVGTYRLERGRSAETLTAPAGAYPLRRVAGVVDLNVMAGREPLSSFLSGQILQHAYHFRRIIGFWNKPATPGQFILINLKIA